MPDILIETYRGFEIKFNVNDGDFYTELDDYGKRSKTLAPVKKGVDDYIKENSAFDPFYVVPIERRYSRERIKITGIRKDGRFVYVDSKGKSSQVSDYNNKDYMLEVAENDVILATIAAKLLEIDGINKEIDQLKTRLKITTLEDVRKRLLAH